MPGIKHSHPSPDVNESSKNFTVVDNGIRFGLAAIKNVGGGAVDSILASRADDERFRHSLTVGAASISKRSTNE